MANIKQENLCRTCLTKEMEVISIYEVCTEAITIQSILSTLTGIKIETGDGLPSTVCVICKEKATDAYNFRQQTLESEATLRKLQKGVDKFEVSEDNSHNYDVKTESFAADNQDVYLDMDFSFDLTNDTDSCEEVKVDTNEHHNVDDNKKPIDKKICSQSNSKENGQTYCPLCSTSFDDTEGLTTHMWDHHADIMGPKKRGRPKRLGTTAILNKLSENGVQVKWVTDMKFNCNFCSEQFRCKDDQDTHVLETHKTLELVNCLLCKKMYLKREDFEKHNCTFHKDSNDKEKEAAAAETEPADNVSKNTLSGTTLLEQVISQLPETDCASDVSACGACGCVCAGQARLARHTDDEHPELSPRCALCGRAFASPRSAARHRAACKHLERAFACTTCGARFAHQVSLNKHILRSHRGQTVSVRFGDRDRARSYRCDICATRFCRKDLLARHIKIHKPSDKVLECDICKKKFHRRSNLRTHMRVHEGGAGAGGAGGGTSACLCLYCGRGFSNSSNLIVHMRRHTGEKPYKCDFCGKGFPRSSDLQCHRRSHTGEKPCICGVCGKGFSRSNKLSRHMRVHTGVKPYKCVYCEKAFSQSNDLTLHVRRHTGDKPYVCEMCGERFIQGTALHNHRRAHGHYPDPAPPYDMHQ